MSLEERARASGVVVVGAGPGVGSAVARAFAGRGHPVALVARKRQRLDELAAPLVASGATVSTVVADASDTMPFVASLKALDMGVPVSVLVYNAAGLGGPLTTTDPADLRRASDVNLHSLVAVVSALRPQLEKTTGTVLITGGGLAMYPSATVGVLSVGKAMTRAAALVLAEELAPCGIAVRTVTIAGLVEPGSPFDPDRIARTYLALHDRALPGPEVVYTGDQEAGT